MINFNLENRVAIVTGGAQGFGYAITERFIKSGAKVIIWDIDEKLLKSEVSEVNNENLNYNVVDVSNYSQIEQNINQITLETNIDILINNHD